MLIPRELEREPNVSWFGLLATITGENPVPSELAGHVAEMTRACSRWAAGRDISSERRVGADLPGPGQRWLHRCLSGEYLITASRGPL
jgi:hypothetical protein